MRCLRVRVASFALILLAAVVNAQNPPIAKTVTVSQGTSMAVAVSPDGNRLVIDLQGALWTLPASGGNATRITDTLHDARQPSWSPDGRRIAFQSYRNGTWDIWTVGADGSGARAVTTGPFDDREPHWSPDGARLAFSSDRSGNYDIWLLELASSEVTRLTSDDGDDYWPAWSPNGREIAFVASRDTGRGIRAVDLGGNERMLISFDQTVGAPAWTPDGSGVVFSTYGAGATRLVAGEREISATEDVFPFRPQWTPGASLVYTADGQIKERAQLDDAGGAPRVIPFRAAFSLTRAAYTPRPRDFDTTSPQRALGIVRPGLSPDGEQIVFAALGDIWTARRGQTPARVTDDPPVDTDPAWSPDGKRLAYSSDRYGSFDVFVRDVQNGSERRVTTASTAEMRPTWSPDGAKLTFVTFHGLASGRLSVVDLASGGIRTVLETTGPLSAGWSPDGRTIYASVLRPASSRFREGVDQVLAIPADPRRGSDERFITLVPHVSSGKRSEGPAWSPDGRHVAAVIDGELHIIPLGPTGEPAGPPRAMGSAAADQLSWSADSRSVLCSENDRLQIVPIDGSAPREWPLDLAYTRAAPDGRFVVHAGRLVDGVRTDARENVDIVVDRNRIARVVVHDEAEHRGRVVDAANLTVMPGLMEAHGHYSAEYGQRFGLLHLAYGITAVRSPGGHPYASIEQREAVEAGRRPGPRLFTAGYLVDGSRIYYPMATPAPTEAAIDREIERARLLKLDLFKTYVRMPDALQQRAIEGAHRIGIPATSHEVHPSAAFGIDSVEHLAATSRRGYSPKQSLLGRSYEDVTAIVSGADMTITPTLALGGLVRRVIGASPDIMADPRWQLLPEWTRAPLEAYAKTPPVPGSPQPRRTMMAFHKAGARIVAGTDAPIVPYGIALHIELEQYVLAGMTPFAALQTATINVARALNVDRDLGTLEPGKLADLTIVEGNPLVDIRATRNVRLVMVNGVLHREVKMEER